MDVFNFRGFNVIKLTMQYKRFPVTPLSGVCLLAQQARLKAFFKSRVLKKTPDSKKLFKFLVYQLQL